MVFYVAVDGRIKGPYREKPIVLAIAAGLSPRAHIRAVGTLAWRPLQDHAPFARALDACEGLRKGAPFDDGPTRSVS